MEKKSWPQIIMISRHAHSWAQFYRHEAEEKARKDPKHGPFKFELPWKEDDVPITPRGEQEAEARGRWFGNLQINQQPNVVLVSPYYRTRQTAELMMAASGISRKKLIVKHDDRLREIQHGDYTYYTQLGWDKLLQEEVKKIQQVGLLAYCQPGGESRLAVVDRLRSLVSELCTVYAGQRVLLITHSVVIKCLWYLLENWTQERLTSVLQDNEADNCSITKYVCCQETGKLICCCHSNMSYLGNPLSEC